MNIMAHRFPSSPRRPTTLAVLLSALCLTVSSPLGQAASVAAPATTPPARAPQPTLPALSRFIESKERQLKAMGKSLGVDIPEEAFELFDLLKESEWKEIQGSYRRLRNASQAPDKTNPDRKIEGMLWTPGLEAYSAMEQIQLLGTKNALALAKDILEVIPPGSLYFGGTDAGRYLISALSADQTKGDPFFTLTQSALPDQTFVAFLRQMYGDKVKLPSDEAVQACFNDYFVDAQKRAEHDQKHPEEPRQLAPAENVSVIDRRVSVSGPGAVMAIAVRLLNSTIALNPDREVFIEENYPLASLRSVMVPHGPILKLSRKPVTELPATVVAQDQTYWEARVKSRVGTWLKKDSSLKEVCQFVEKVHGNRDLKGVEGDHDFLQNRNARIQLSRMRNTIASVFAWHAEHDAAQDSRKRMRDAAEYAFKQAMVLGPLYSDGLLPYVQFLKSQGRNDDARLVSELGVELNP